MAIRTVVTRGFGNGTFSGTISLVVARGYATGAAIISRTKMPRLQQATTRIIGLDTSATSVIGMNTLTTSVIGMNTLEHQER